MPAARLALFLAPVASALLQQGRQEQKAISDEIIAFDTAPQQQVESNRQMFTLSSETVSPAKKKAILEKVARSIATDRRGFFSHLNQTERKNLAAKVAREEDVSFIDVVAPPSPMSRPVLVPPRMRSESEGGPRASFLESASVGSESGEEDFQPAAGFEDTMTNGFEDTMAELTEAASDSRLPWGIGSPRTGDSLPNFHYANMPAVDIPKEWEYSLDSGDNIQSFSTAQQDVKLITQVLENVTNGFYLDTNAGYGEHGSNTLLLEILGWRGLLIEPRAYAYLSLWGKMRKAWLFLGCLSPYEKPKKIGFDSEGMIDMLHGHKIHSYSVKDFMAEMGGRSTIDFWNLRSGGYDTEILQETLLEGGKSIEFGAILVRFDARPAGRGPDWFVKEKSLSDTEEAIFEIFNKSGFKYIGGLDPYWINKVNPKYGYNDVLFVNPSYFEKRKIPTPTAIKSAPPPSLSLFKNGTKWPGYDSWDSGFDFKQEVAKVKAYLKKSKSSAAMVEPLAKANRIDVKKLSSPTKRIT